MTDSVRICNVARIDDGAGERRQHASADVAPELYDAPGHNRTHKTTQTTADDTTTEQR